MFTVRFWNNWTYLSITFQPIKREAPPGQICHLRTRRCMSPRQGCWYVKKIFIINCWTWSLPASCSRIMVWIFQIEPAAVADDLQCSNFTSKSSFDCRNVSYLSGNFICCFVNQYQLGKNFKIWNILHHFAMVLFSIGEFRDEFC